MNRAITPKGYRRSKATARIQVTVEVVAGTWGSDCTVEQVQTQAAREALAKVSRLVGIEGRVYDPKVIAVLVEEDRP